MGISLQTHLWIKIHSHFAFHTFPWYILKINNIIVLLIGYGQLQNTSFIKSMCLANNSPVTPDPAVNRVTLLNKPQITPPCETQIINNSDSRFYSWQCILTKSNPWHHLRYTKQNVIIENR